MGMRAALYLRVSTARQAEKDLSIPDQRRQAEDFCKAKGWEIVAQYVEPGKSATDDKRPKLQDLMAAGTSPDKPFDVVVVHSFSRFFRDAYQFEYHRRKLDRRDVSIVSITQELGNDPMGDMVRQILNLFDEYQSKENAKHVLRAMKENARQGYWNGSHPPYGYRAIAVEVRADAVKKRLEVDPPESEIVGRVFDLYLEGKGIRSIADALNTKGYRYRNGRRFNSSLVHQMLTRTAYMGKHQFNRTECKTRRKKDPSEWVEFATPVIIEPGLFERVRAMLKARRPANTPPRIVNGPTLLTGIAKCPHCGGGMTLRTGKGGRYRYYTCNARATEGNTACHGHSIPMAKLDDLVLIHFADRILSPERMEQVLGELIKRSRERSVDLAGENKRLNKELRAVEEKVDRLYEALADGLIRDNDGFRRNLSKFEQQKDELIRQIGGLNRRRDIPKDLFSKENLSRFAEATLAKLQAPDGDFRKRYLRLFVDRVEVGENEIRITGPKHALVNGLAEITKPGHRLPVPSFATDWWAHKDSNLVPAD